MYRLYNKSLSINFHENAPSASRDVALRRGRGGGAGGGGGRGNMAKLIVAFCDFSNTHKKHVYKLVTSPWRATRFAGKTKVMT